MFLFVYFEIGSHCVAQAGLELEILLPQPLKGWDYRCAPPFLASTISLSAYMTASSKFCLLVYFIMPPLTLY
jgi:hypothetical protein